MILALCCAVALIASSVARSPLLAVMTCLTSLLSYQRGARIGVFCGVVVAAIAFTLDPYTVHPVHLKVIASIVALFFASVVSGDQFGRLGTVATSTRAAAPAARATRAVDTPARGVRAVEPRRSVAVEVEPESSMEQDTISRFLREMREQIGGDEIVLWRYLRDSDELLPVSSASSAIPKVTFETNPPLESLVHWAVQQQLPTTNYDTEPSVFLTAAVGKEGRFQGGIGVYAEDRESIARDRAKVFLPRYATRLGLLLDMLNDGKETRRYRGKADKVAVAAQKIQNSQTLDSLGAAICESALDVSSGTRCAFVRWNQGEEKGTVSNVSPLHTIPPEFPVSGDSIVAKALHSDQRIAVRESYRKSDMPVFGPGEPSRKIGSLAIVRLQLDDELLGYICVEGDEESQLTSVEGELLSMLAPVASAALKNVEQLQDVTAKSNHDMLTGLANRRQFEERLRQHLAEHGRTHLPVSLILLDIDMFKTVNDVYVHQGGD